MAVESNGAKFHPSDEMLAAFVDGTLNEIQLEKMESHLAECDDCRAFVSDWAKVVLASAGERGEVVERVGESPVRVVRGESILEHEGEVGRQEAVIKCLTCAKAVDPYDAFCRHCGMQVGSTAVKAMVSDSHSLFEIGSLILGIICFVVSFFVPPFFWQFLIACSISVGIYLYFRIKREILLELINALRSGDSSKEKEAIEKLRRKFRE